MVEALQTIGASLVDLWFYIAGLKLWQILIPIGGLVVLGSSFWGFLLILIRIAKKGIPAVVTIASILILLAWIYGQTPTAKVKLSQRPKVTLADIF